MTDSPTSPARGQEAEATLHQSLRWQDAFALAMAVSGGIFVSFGATMAAIGALSALALWALASAIGWLQNNLFAEMASMFKDKPGGVPTYAYEAWRERFAPAGAIASFGYWFGWAAVLSIVSVTAGGVIQARWFPEQTWALDVGIAQLGLGQLLGIGLILAILVPNLFGAQLAAWVNKVVGAALLVPLLIFIAAPAISGQWSAANLTWGLGGPGADAWGGWQNAIAWLYLIGWTAYGTEMCAAFTPEYRSAKDARKALFTSGGYTFLMFALVPLGVGGLVSQDAAASDVGGIFVNAFAAVIPIGPVADIMLLILLGALLMGVNTGMADASRALYGAALDGLVPRQLEKLNRHGVPARALWTAVAMNIGLIVLVSNPISILVAANLGYLLAILLAVAGFLVLRRDHPGLARSFRAGAYAVPLAAVLTVYGAVVLLVGALSAEITGYGGPVELAIGVGILLLSLVLFVIRRRVQDNLPLFRDPRPAPNTLPSQSTAATQ
ncbi:APC family permease [Arthrobacter sp. I2-34]|uniref:APC family permease n=1 Tax=Arthrobacter hankyongi TaxID=2904801 RepID=A0ABS9L2R1_9MICC|nr:APC family permease [Arthrobacter hankyongi]MCG2620782.1 APC family permease [Arthrobacter hankyongi]